MVAACFHCGLPGAVFACGHCCRAFFCGAECQKGGWKRHRPECFQVAETCSGSSGGSLSSSSPRPAPASEPAQSLLLHAMAAKLCSKNAIRVYPNVGAAQGEIDLEVARRSTDAEIREALARVVFRDARAVKIFSSQGHEVCSPEQFWAEAPSGLVVSAGGPFRRRGQKEIQAGHSTSPRYDPSLVGSRAIRIDAEDPEVESLLRAPVPLVITGSKVAGEALGRWNFEYLEKCLSDVDNFFVLCSPEKSKGRFSYYDFSEGKNPCGYKIVPNNHRVEMRFPEFRQKVQSAQGKGDLYYLQNTLLHREEHEAGPPRPVGRFGQQCGCKVSMDIDAFRWDWLKRVMGHREPQMCQLFCGTEGFSPCHYDPQDNMFLQVTGYKRVILFHPRHFGCLYPWPVHHPQDRQSRVDFDQPDLQSFPRFQELKGQGIEAILEPGDLLHIPPGWWHHVEMMPSPKGEVVSFNFWYPPPTWFHGDLAKGQITWDRPLFGVRRVLYQRCVEELVAHAVGPSKVSAVLKLALEKSPRVPDELVQGLEQLDTFLGPVMEGPERQQLLLDILEGRFLGLKT
ncbi:Hypoxia-inducible factor 1-alpha inhibitor (Factor inhibiting HIF-1) (FIH-1) (Hypoxia-inducible factor asparagine hydroxylase) [Durusdinium trenchii]|uniref:Hypoxia-inducible factor 1-alpha inhibitor (Factor inhibiting HIF-1) (FIH-1) (Hypoxia-inducible factor asparagine hydroxylase) n=2 Tax=Durusdinium trenchii TaxID=1381693 RepID=A0ABP0RHB1_9DINO